MPTATIAKLKPARGATLAAMVMLAILLLAGTMAAPIQADFPETRAEAEFRGEPVTSNWENTIGRCPEPMDPDDIGGMVTHIRAPEPMVATTDTPWTHLRLTLLKLMAMTRLSDEQGTRIQVAGEPETNSTWFKAEPAGWTTQWTRASW